MGFAALSLTIIAIQREGYRLTFKSLINSGFGKVQPQAFAWVIHGLSNKVASRCLLLPVHIY